MPRVKREGLIRVHIWLDESDWELIKGISKVSRAASEPRREVKVMPSDIIREWIKVGLAKGEFKSTPVQRQADTLRYLRQAAKLLTLAMEANKTT